MSQNKHSLSFPYALACEISLSGKYPDHTNKCVTKNIVFLPKECSPNAGYVFLVGYKSLQTIIKLVEITIVSHEINKTLPSKFKEHKSITCIAES